MGSIQHEARNDTETFSDYEQVYLRMSRAFKHLDKEHWGIRCVCTIQCNTDPGTDIVGSIRNAWIRLLSEYPGLGMTPVATRKQYLDFDQDTVLAWAANTFFSDNDLDAKIILGEAKPRDLPSLFYIPPTSQVILLIQHWRADGLGACMLLDRLFELLAEEINTRPPRSSPGHLRSSIIPSPSMESATDSASLSTPDPDLQAYAHSYIDNFHARAVHAGGLPFSGTPSTPPSRTTHQSLTLSTALTSSIVQSCRELTTSASAAIHAALAQTVLSYLDAPDRRAGYTTVMAVNMRPYLPAPYNGREHACQTYVASITPTVPDGAALVDAAQQLTAEYRGWHNDKFMRALRWIYKFHLEKLSAPKPAAGEEGSVPVKPPSGVTLSSLGVVERHLKGEYGDRLSVREFRFGVSMMTRQTILYAWTFRGRMTLSLNYNEAYYTRDMAKEVLGSVAKGLGDGLGVGSGVGDMIYD